LRNIRCNDLDETHAMTDRRTIDRRGTNHKQRTAYLLEDWLKDPAWWGDAQLGRGTLVHDSKSRERSARAHRSRMTTAVVLLAGNAVVEGRVITGFHPSL